MTTPNAKTTKSPMEQELERLRAENAALKAKANGPVTLKVSDKGAVSVYGMGRFPVTLYQEQWLKLLAQGDNIKAFIETNKAKLSVKGDAKPGIDPANAVATGKPSAL